MVIRPARDDDAPALREIFNEAVQDALATFDTEPVSLDEQRRRLAAAAAEARQPILVAELRGWAVGWITIQQYDLRRHMEDVGEVTVFVQRSFRKYGVGRQLMQAVQKEAQRLGYRKLIGHVLAENQDSLRLCRATGWREVGCHLQHALRDGPPRDVVVVECLLPGA